MKMISKNRNLFSKDQISLFYLLLRIQKEEFLVQKLKFL